ncbi:MAG: GNAT family N-acetyltransferase [Balneolaceae bacterium]|nr:GNAT family N-acetyltransferase [Balneolaceae bacterium]
MKIRRFQTPDKDQIAQLFHDTIRSVNLGDYSEKQVKAWAPDEIYFRDWKQKCSSTYTLVADSNGIVAGFAQLDDDGHIDCFYSHKDFQGQGIGRLLFEEIESEALKRNLTKLFLEASITAKVFFKKMGFAVTKKQTVKIRGAKLINYIMEKEL